MAFLNYTKEELFLVLGTSSSEAALPGMLAKMRRLGCAESTVGLVIPAGYSFNLDGTNIYMTMAAMFLAQATNTHLDLGQQLSLLVVAMLSSKGATGVTGAGFSACGISVRGTVGAVTTAGATAGTGTAATGAAVIVAAGEAPASGDDADIRGTVSVARDARFSVDGPGACAGAAVAAAAGPAGRGCGVSGGGSRCSTPCSFAASLLSSS